MLLYTDLSQSALVNSSTAGQYAFIFTGQFNPSATRLSFTTPWYNTHPFPKPVTVWIQSNPVIGTFKEQNHWNILQLSVFRSIPRKSGTLLFLHVIKNILLYRLVCNCSTKYDNNNPRNERGIYYKQIQRLVRHSTLWNPLFHQLCTYHWHSTIGTYEVCTT